MREKFISASTLSDEEIKSVLLKKINEEQNKIIDDTDGKLLLQKVTQKKGKANVVSLFSGAGGLDLGLELAGIDAVKGEKFTDKILSSKSSYLKNRNDSIFHISYSNDNFKEANETYENMFPNDVVKNSKDIRKIASFPECQVMVGGFPCPGFSAAGPRLIDDPRNFLYIHYIRALLETQPAFFVGENVKGLLTLARGEVFKQLKQDFATAGYEVKAFLVNARDYGVPQLRERVILVGTNKKKIKEKYNWSYELPEPTNGDGLLNQKPFVTLKDAIGDLPENPDDVFEGSYSPIFMSRNRKKTWNEQSFTIQASGRQAPIWPGGEPMVKVGKDKWEFQGDKNRRLSVREIARIQTFPDWFEFSGGSSNNKNGYLAKKYKQIGNAVPVELARKVLFPIAQFFVDHPEMTK